MGWRLGHFEVHVSTASRPESPVAVPLYEVPAIFESNRVFVMIQINGIGPDEEKKVVISFFVQIVLEAKNPYR